MSKVIGIDLGTTNSCVAIMEGKDVRVIENSEGARTTPSMVAFADSGERLVGQSAKRQAGDQPDQHAVCDQAPDRPPLTTTRWSPRTRRMVPYTIVRGDNGDAWVEASGEKYSPSQISAFILGKMKETAEAYLGEPVTQAVITVPGLLQRQPAPGHQGCRPHRRPGSAAHHQRADRGGARLRHGQEAAGTIAVYDLGGGTFDISVLEIGDGVFEVKSTNGDTFLGGEDFDAARHRLPGRRVQNASRASTCASDKLALQRLKEAAEKAKIELSSSKETEVNLPFITADASGPKHLVMKLTRAKLEALVDDLIQRTLEPCKAALKDAGVTAGEIDEVILVGGMTRMPKVIETVKSFFGKRARPQRQPRRGRGDRRRGAGRAC